MYVLIGMIFVMALAAVLPSDSFAGEYRGRYCEGKGDVGFLRLIDQSFGFFHPNPDYPNISMLYLAEWDGLVEGAQWGAWWIQNSYGPTYCALPFLQEPWLTALQHSQDFWFKHQGDGRSKDSFDAIRPEGVPELIAPDGCLVDAASPDGSYHRQGDCKWWIHDWGLEFTAAGVVMQGELLLISRDKTAIDRYLPNLERACNFIETCRDPKNNLFLAGPAANLLAPSYGGVRQPDGSFGKGYPAGLSITYLAACDRMVELFRLVDDKEKASLYQSRREITKDSLPLLLTDDGYFVKYLEPDGTKHGVYGQEKWGYFESVVNVDALAFRVVDQPRAEKIYWRIATLPELRPHDFVITNYPGLDDIYDHWGTRETTGLWEYGRWLNGGVWATVEARAILAYYRLGKFEDVRKSALRSMKFADDFRMDAPLTEFGDQVWFTDKPTNLCYDALGIPAATVRGLFEYVYKSDSLTLYPHIPPAITEYAQKEPIRFGEKSIFITVKNGGPRVKSVEINGRNVALAAPDSVTLPYGDLAKRTRVEIVTEGGWSSQTAPGCNVETGQPMVGKVVDLPESLRTKYESLMETRKILSDSRASGRKRAFLDETVAAFEAYRERASRDAAGAYSRFSAEKCAAILKMYEDAALVLYKSYEGLFKAGASSTETR